MNKIPDEFDHGILMGRTLEMICFAAYQVNFHFDGQLSIIARTSFGYGKSSDARGGSEVTIPVAKSDLMQLLERRVAKTTVEEQHILTLVFDSNEMLRFYDTAPGRYESYELIIDGKRIII